MIARQSLLLGRLVQRIRSDDSWPETHTDDGYMWLSCIRRLTVVL